MRNYEKLLTTLNQELDRQLGKALTPEQLEEKYCCENSFYLFAQRAWPIIEGGVEFIPGWHVQAICEHLEALYNLEIRNLIINCPPRVGKSNVCSVLYAAWVWTKSPNLKFLYTSYKEGLSVRDSVKCRRLILSPWYQTYWGSKYQLTHDVNTKLRFENTQSGYRIASSVSGGNTGEGGHFEVCLNYNTLIRTNLGDIQIGRIVEEKIDCAVASFNHKINEIEYQPIQDYMKNPSPIKDEMIEIELEDGKIIECTGNHPIYTERGYIEAKNLRMNDIVFCL
jgi:hypothetical protein